MYFSVQAQVVAERKAIWGSCTETWLCVRTEYTEWTSLSCLLALDYFKLSWMFKSARLKTCVNDQLLWQIHQLSRAFFTLAPGHRVVLIVQPLALIVIKKAKILWWWTFRIEFTCIFSVGKLFFTCGAGDDASYVRFGETKDKYFNQSLRHGTEICVLIRF